MRSHSQEHAPSGSVCRLSQRMKSPGPECPTRTLPEAPVRWRNALQQSALKRIMQRSLCSMEGREIAGTDWGRGRHARRPELPGTRSNRFGTLEAQMGRYRNGRASLGPQGAATRKRGHHGDAYCQLTTATGSSSPDLPQSAAGILGARWPTGGGSCGAWFPPSQSRIAGRCA